MTTWLIRLGTAGGDAEELIEAGYLGVDYVGDVDIREHLGQGSDAFRKAMIPVYIEQNPGMSRVTAGRAMGNLHAASETMLTGDLVLSPTGGPNIRYHYGIVVGDYEFHPGQVQPHRRRVDWKGVFSRVEMSSKLASLVANPQTVFKVDPVHAEELAQLTRMAEPAEAAALSSLTTALTTAVPAEVQDPLAFQMEKQLEDFLVHNWSKTALGAEYDIFETEEEGIIGRQYATDTGPMDILAISKDRQRLLVIELKRGRASDVVVGQIQRYMGYAAAELAESGQDVEGVIIAQEDDNRIRRALSVARNIRFMRYRVEFHLEE